MTLGKKLIAGGFAAMALLATAGAAFAAPAYATGNVNVRSGPGTGYGQVDVLRRGEQVDVVQCRGSWCYIEKRGPDGWVSANYLDRGGRPGGGNGPGWNNGPGWDNGPGWNNPRPPRPPHWNNPRPPRPQPQPWPGYDNGYNPGYPGNNNGGSVCFNGPNGYFCVGN